MDLGSSLAACGAVVATGLLVLVAVRRVLRSRAGARALAESAARGRDLPLSLHPVIDPDVCIGSLACIRSCPEGDILGLVNGAARLVHGDHCVGHGRCAAECPVNAIQLVFGTARRGVDLPEVSETFESSRPGVHVVGELGGMGLVRNAMRQGLECAEYLAAALGPGRRTGEAADVLVIGAGPAGLAVALGCRQAGLSYRLVDQAKLGGAVAHYPRHKVVMTEAVDLPLVGRFGKREMSKEELMDGFRRIVARGGLEVEEGVRVIGLEGADGAFEAVAEGGARLRARKVVLAIGRRGSPRRMGVPGEELPKVTYALDAPEAYRGSRVLVVGGGDSALEAAGALVEAGAEVALSYRGDAFGRCRAENRARVETLAREGRVALKLASNVVEVGSRDVTLSVRGSPARLANDYVLACLGGELPLELLQRIGVSLRRYHGEALGAPRKSERGSRDRYLRATQGKERAQRRREHLLAAALTLAGVAILAFLAWRGRDYYLLDTRARLRSPLHHALRSAGPWGHGVGIGATLFMLSNFLYAARKRLAFMRSWGHIRLWLHFHTFVGFMSPLVIAFHAAFQSKNLLASSTAGALAVVVVTGIIGRFVYGIVPAAGRAEELEDLQARMVRLRDEVGPLLVSVRDPARVKRLFQRAAAPVRGRSLLLTLLAWPFRRIAARTSLRAVRGLFPDRAVWLEFHDAYLRTERLRVQIGFYRSLKRFLGAWRAFHAALAIFLVLVMAAHIGVSLYLGYGLLHLR